MEGKERITNTKKGLWLHPTIAVTPERVMLGIVDVNFWKRKLKVNSKGSNQDKLPIENKESYRWLQSYRRSCEIAREERQLQTTKRMKALITVFMVLAWRVMFTMMMGRVRCV